MQCREAGFAFEGVPCVVTRCPRAVDLRTAEQGVTEFRFRRLLLCSWVLDDRSNVQPVKLPFQFS